MTFAMKELGGKKRSIPLFRWFSLCNIEAVREFLCGNGFLNELHVQKLTSFFKGGYQVWMALCINQLNLDI